MQLRKLPLLTAVVALLSWAASAAPEASEALGGGRVVIVPLNLGVRAASEVEPGVQPVWHELLSHFGEQSQPATALERSSAAALWGEVMSEVSTQPNPDVYQAYALFARRIADQVEYSAIVFPSLVTRAARVSGDTATWDGVRRHVAVVGRDTVGSVLGSQLLIESQGVRGELAAASLHVAVLSPDGELRYEGAGGLSLLQRIDEAQKSARADQIAVELRQDAFADPTELREGVVAAFRRPLPASRAH